MPVKVFFCYAHEDEPLLNKLKSHLRPLQRQGLIDVWHDRDISAGTEWEREISERLNSAQIILLLVSPDFMDSDYCYSTEMQRAMERHERGEARVIPIILRRVRWQEAPFGKLHALPKDGEPVTSAIWHNLDDAFYDVDQGIRKAVMEIVELELTQPPVADQQTPEGTTLEQIVFGERKQLVTTTPRVAPTGKGEGKVEKVEKMQGEKVIIPKKPFDKPTPTEIMDYLRNLPPLQREDAAGHYKGIKVSWVVRIESSEKKPNGNVSIITQYERHISPAIFFEIELVKYPELKIINKDQEFKIEGEIDKVSQGGSITLTNCKLYF